MESNVNRESVFEDENLELVELVFDAMTSELSGVESIEKRVSGDFVSIDLTDRDGMWHIFFTGSQRNYIRAAAFAEGCLSGLCRVSYLSQEMQCELTCR